MSLLAFALQVLPVTALALAATAIGAAVPVSEAARMPLLLVGVLLFVGLLIFRGIRGWNLALLLGLAAAAGALMGSGFEAVRDDSWVGALILMVVLTCLAALIGSALWGRLRRAGSALRGRLRVVGFALWALAWVYLAGWLFAGLFDPPAWLRVVWAVAGLLIFSCLVVVWSSQLGSEEIPPRRLAVAQGTDLYLLGMNIAVAARVLLA